MNSINDSIDVKNENIEGHGEMADDEEVPETCTEKVKSRKRKSRTNKSVDDDEDWVPERRSKRLQVKSVERSQERQRLIDLGLIKGEKYWKEFEKKTLLSACKEFGSKNVEKIVERVPTKPPDKVKSYIQREKRNINYTIETQFIEDDGETFVLDDGETGRAQNQGNIDLPDVTPKGQIIEILKRRERNAPIEKWIDGIEKRFSSGENRGTPDNDKPANFSTIMPTVLNWIAEFETHPDPSECGGVDYASIYRYLALLCEGEAPPDLDRATSLRVSRLLPMLSNVIDGLSIEKETKYLENYRGPFSKYKWEDGFDYNSKECKEFIELGKIPGMNTLNFHPEMFIQKEIPRIDELIKLFNVDNIINSD